MLTTSVEEERLNDACRKIAALAKRCRPRQWQFWRRSVHQTETIYTTLDAVTVRELAERICSPLGLVTQVSDSGHCVDIREGIDSDYVVVTIHFTRSR